MERAKMYEAEQVLCVSDALTVDEKHELQGMIQQLVKVKKPESMLLQFCEGSEEKMQKDIAKFSYLLKNLADKMKAGQPFPIQHLRIILFSWGHRFQCAVKDLIRNNSKEEIAKRLRVNDVLSVVDKLYMDAPNTELDTICEEIDKTIQRNEAIWMSSCLPRLQETVAALKLDMVIDVATDGKRDDYFLYWYRQLLSVYSENQRSFTQEAGKRRDAPEFYQAREAVRASIHEAGRPDDVHKSFKDFFCLAPSEAKITKPVKQLAKKRLQQIVAKDYFDRNCTSDDALKRALEDVLAVYILAGQIYVGLSFLPSMRNQNPCSLHMILYTDNAPQKFLLDRINGGRQHGTWRGEKLTQIMWIAPKPEMSTLSPPLSSSQETDTSSSSFSQEQISSSSSQGTSGSPRLEAVRSLSPMPTLRMPAAFAGRPQTLHGRWRYIVCGLNRLFAWNDYKRALRDGEKCAPRMEDPVQTSHQGTNPMSPKGNVVVDLAKLSLINREATQAFVERAIACGRTDIAKQAQSLSTIYGERILGIIAGSQESSFHGGNWVEKTMSQQADPELSTEYHEASFFSKDPERNCIQRNVS